MSILNRANTTVQIAELSEIRLLQPNEGDWTTRAYDLMELLILDQYTNSVNLKLYMKAFLDELDLLMFETHNVYLGRMLEFAVGRQLDIIGEILQQSRSIILPKGADEWFQFQGVIPAPTAYIGMADEKTPTIGGVFKSENWYPWEFVPLTDKEYRGVLLARGYVCNNKTRDINTTYKVIHLILARVPAHIKLIVNSERNITLELVDAETSEVEAALLDTVKHWYIPMGVVFSVSLI